MSAILKASKPAAIVFQYGIGWLFIAMGTVGIYYVVGTEILSTGKWNLWLMFLNYSLLTVSFKTHYCMYQLL